MDTSQLTIVGLMIFAFWFFFKLKDRRKRKRARQRKNLMDNHERLLEACVYAMESYQCAVLGLTQRLDACVRIEVYAPLLQERRLQIHQINLDRHNMFLRNSLPWLQIEILLMEIELLLNQVANLKMNSTGLEYIDLLESICSIPENCLEANRGRRPFVENVQEIEMWLRNLVRSINELEKSTAAWERRIEGSSYDRRYLKS